MDKKKEELEISNRSKEWLNTLAKTQQQGIDVAVEILQNLLDRGISYADIEYGEDMCYDIERLTGLSIPYLEKDFRDMFSLLTHTNFYGLEPDILPEVRYLMVVVDQVKKYLKHRIEYDALPDLTSPIELKLGRFMKNIDFLEHKMYEVDTEILQLSFNSMMERNENYIVDKGYWFELKSRKIHYTYRVRPARNSQYVKGNDTEFDVLQPEKLLVYPGNTNCRIRCWGATGRRELTSKDMAVLQESAETDYAETVSRTKEGFRDPLREYPALLIKLHKTFMNGDHLVLEDEKGGLLTVMDVPKDNAPTSELLRAILPVRPAGCALLVEVNDDGLESDLFSVKPLSVITSDRIIRLLY